jgi:hypothetical protein
MHGQFFSNQRIHGLGGSANRPRGLLRVGPQKTHFVFPSLSGRSGTGFASRTVSRHAAVACANVTGKRTRRWECWGAGCCCACASVSAGVRCSRCFSTTRGRPPGFRVCRSVHTIQRRAVCRPSILRRIRPDGWNLAIARKVWRGCLRQLASTQSMRR